MWFLCILLFGVCSAFPHKHLPDAPKIGQLNVQLTRLPLTLSQRFCLPSFLTQQICLPLPFPGFFPLQFLNSENQRCILIPLMRAHVIKVCPPKRENSSGENLRETPKEIIKEVEEEKEKELLPDNANTEVKGKEVEPENFVRKENGVKSKEFKVEDKDMESKNKIIRVSEEIIEVTKAKNPIQQPLLDSLEKNSDEDVSIASNLV